MNNIGVQLYSFTRDCDLDLMGRIKAAGALGYSFVEFAGGYNDIPVANMKKALADAGVQALSAHVGLDNLEKDLPYLAALGVKLIIVPGAPFSTRQEAKELAEDLNAFGKKCAPYGIKTGYHNHTSEFFTVEGKYLMDWLISYSDKDNVVFELDCGWVSAAGLDPVAYINAHKGRIAAIHVKENKGTTGIDAPQSRHDTTPKWDIKKDENGNDILPAELLALMEAHEKINVPQGTGDVDWSAVKAAADAQYEGVLYVVERESSYNQPKDRVACLKDDIIWLKANI